MKDRINGDALGMVGTYGCLGQIVAADVCLKLIIEAMERRGK